MKKVIIIAFIVSLLLVGCETEYEAEPHSGTFVLL